MLRRRCPNYSESAITCYSLRVTLTVNEGSPPKARIEHQKFLYHLNLGIYFASINKSKHFRQALWFLVCSHIHSPFVL